MPASHVTELEYGGRQLVIVGTAHISKKSVEEVERVIANVVPDTVCVELDQSRYEALRHDGAVRHFELGEAIRKGRVPFVLASLLLTAFQRRLGQRLGVMPGAELLAATRAAERVGARVVLADRDIHVTLSRTWARLSPWNKLKLAFVIVLAFASGGEISERDVEELKERETVADAMDQLARAMPPLKQSLIDERDRCLMSALKQAPGRKIVAVVGAGHVAGMLTHLDETIDREALARMPRRARHGAPWRWLVSAAVLGLLGWTLATRPLHDFEHLLVIWAAWTAGSVGLGTALARPKPLTLAAGILCAPLTALSPAFGAAEFAGLIEAGLRKPDERDRARLREDILSVRGALRNAVTRVLLVSLLAGFGAAVGAVGGTIGMLLAL